MEIWETTGREAMDAAIATGKVVNLGETGMQAKEEWWYPIYMKETVPGPAGLEGAEGPPAPRPSRTAETAPKGRYLGGPVTWGGFDEERVEALDLPFEVIHAGTDAALFAELESAYQRKAPILLWIYAPHWAPAKYEGEWVEFPAYDGRLLHRPGLGHATRTPPTTAASRPARSGRSAGSGVQGEVAGRLRGDQGLQHRQRRRWAR